MRKEVIFAIVAGILIGLVTAFGAWKTVKALKPKPTPVTSKETPRTKITTEFSIENYSNYDIVTNDPIIKGRSNPNDNIIISTYENDYLAKTDANGNFEANITVSTGLSKIKFINTTTQEEIYLILVFSTEVEENLKATTGTITDISSGTVQVRIQNGGIAQISIDTETKLINTLKKSAEIKESDLAIGDYIVGMGSILANKVLQAKRILVTSTLVENNVKAERIKIEKLTKTSINDIALPKKWSGPDIKELEVGQEIYIVGTESNDKTHTLRSIFIPVD